MYDYLGAQAQPNKLVKQELDAVQPGQMSVLIGGQSPPVPIKRVGPVNFDLVVHQNSPVADKMEYPIEKGQTHQASVGAHCMVIKMNQTGKFDVRVDFDGLRGFKNRARTKLVVQ